MPKRAQQHLQHSQPMTKLPQSMIQRQRIDVAPGDLVAMPYDAQIDQDLIGSQLAPDPFIDHDPLELVVSGQIALIDIFIPTNALVSSEDTNTYGDVKAEFCQVEFGIQKTDPHLVPMFRDIVGKSSHCTTHRYTLRLLDVIAACQARDSEDDANVHAMSIEAFIFHEPRSGSSVLANAILMAEPTQTRILSEARVVLEALNACHDDLCDRTKHMALVRDVLYLSSRTNDPMEQQLYVKIPPSGTVHLDIVRETFPNAKWLFVTRDPNVVLQKLMNDGRNSCIKSRRNPSAGMLQYVLNKGMRLEDLTDVEVCSAYLATMTATAWEEHHRSSTGRIVDYDTEIRDSNVLLDAILTNYLGISVSEISRERIRTQLKMRTNGRGAVWTGDDVMVDLKTRTASNLFL